MSITMEKGSVVTTIKPLKMSQEMDAQHFDESQQHNTINPLSAFYCHPTTRSSLERAKSESRTHLPSYEMDVEAAKGSLAQSASHTNLIGQARKSQDVSFEYKGKEESSVWPSMQTWKRNAKRDRREQRMRTWLCLGSLNRSQRLAAKIIIVLVIAAIAVGVSVGISVAVHGSVYKSNGVSQTIPPPHRKA